MKTIAAIAAMLAASSAFSASQVAATDSHIARMGRLAEQLDGAVRIAYPGVSLAFSFTGKTLSVDAWSSGTSSAIDVTIDGGETHRIRLGMQRATYTLLDAPTAGAHRVEIMHPNETWHGIVTLAGLATDGELGAPPTLPERRMLVLGDSVTCAEGVKRGTGKLDPSWNDARHSYGMLAAQALGAQVHLVCYGGRGLVRSWNKRTDEHNLPDFYELAIPDPANPVPWDHERYQPDLIVSAIGTNDFTPGVPDREAYVSTYVKFVRTLLRNHPRARIVLTEGAILNGANKDIMRSYIAETVTRVGDKRVRAVSSAYYPGDAADAHPTGEQHAMMARDLVPQLRQTMGW